MAAEFDLLFPSTVVTLATVKNPNAIPIDCCLPPGISIAFNECQVDWVWLYQLTMMSLATIPAKIEIIPHPLALAYQFATCELGYPIEPCINLTPLYICQEGGYGVEETNWGAIKSLF